jgi:hypothetical protein
MKFVGSMILYSKVWREEVEPGFTKYPHGWRDEGGVDISVVMKYRADWCRDNSIDPI